jgi:hypothetical protein
MSLMLKQGLAVTPQFQAVVNRSHCKTAQSCRDWVAVCTSGTKHRLDREHKAQASSVLRELGCIVKEKYEH